MALDNKTQMTRSEEEQNPEQDELDLDLHEANPFLDGFRVATRGKRTTIGGQNLAVVDLETGVLEGTAELTQRVAVDREQFVKVFQAQVGAFFGLTSAGIKVLTAIWQEAARKPNDDRVYMTEKTAARHAKTHGGTISRATFYRGRANLIKHGFLAASADPHLYWINPAIFFNGDRVKLVSELIRAPEIAAPGKKFSNE